MEEPTKEQQRWLWEQCGYVGKLESIQPVEGQREGRFVYVSPPVNLNNLLKFAVPKLQPEVIKLVPVNDGVTSYADKWGCILIPKGWGNHISVISDSPDPAVALWWALFKALGGKE